MFYANQIPTVSTQLSIIANVHQGSSGDGDVRIIYCIVDLCYGNLLYTVELYNIICIVFL